MGLYPLEIFGMQKEAVNKMVLHFVTAPFLLR